jgi:hypothetical protein
MANVKFVRQELLDLLPSYQLVEDCVKGQEAIKLHDMSYFQYRSIEGLINDSYQKIYTRYLPQPNPSDTSTENYLRYVQYIERAVFYNVTKRTLNGFIGQIFQKDFTVELPDEIEYLEDDVTGSQIDLEQFSKICAEEVISIGRCGILVDYPTTNGPTSKQDMEEGNIRPTFTFYKSKDIINWRTIKDGAKEKLSLIVLQETYPMTVEGDIFGYEEGTQYRVLQLIDGVYYWSIYKEGVNNNVAVPGPLQMVVGPDGLPLTEIQFEFIGSDANDPRPDVPPLYDLAAMNIAHYRNSADYEETTYIVGQITPYFTGLSQDWVDNVLKGSIQLGSRAAVPLPLGATAGLIQAEPNSMAFEAMGHKERQMVALGARLVEQKAVQRTGLEANLEASSEASCLATIADNISCAIEKALKRAANFVGIPSEGIEFDLNTDFAIAKMTQPDRAQTIKDWQAGAISRTEMRNALRNAGVPLLDDTTSQAEIDKDDAADLDKEVETTKQMTAITQPKGVPNEAI